MDVFASTIIYHNTNCIVYGDGKKLENIDKYLVLNRGLKYLPAKFSLTKIQEDLFLDSVKGEKSVATDGLSEKETADSLAQK